jgi:uncharacterized protein YecT (DUF1311 family)
MDSREPVVRLIDHLAKIALVAAIAVLTAAPAAVGRSAKKQAVAPDCMDRATSQLDMTLCAKQMAENADRRLNRSYQAALCYMGPDEQRQLIAAEKAWIAYRDADCALWGSGGGSIAPMNELLCREDLSNKRAEELDSWPPNAERGALESRCVR